MRTTFSLLGIMFFSLLLFARPAVADIEDGLLGHWTLDDGVADPGTTIAADSVGDHHGTLVNGPVWADSILDYGGALSFDGTDDHVEIPHSDDLTFSVSDSYTVATWVNVRSLPGAWAAVVNKSRDLGSWYGIWIDGSNQWCAGTEPENTSGSAVTLGPHHVAIVQDNGAGTRILYLDGQVDATGSAQNATGAGDLWFGGAKSVNEYFDGVVDDVRIYNRALSAEDIEESYNWTGSVVSAGPDRRVEAGQTLTLEGSGPADATSFSWEQIIVSDEPVVALSDPNSATTIFTPPSREIGYILTFRLTVVSLSEGTLSDEVAVTVTAPNPPKIAPSNLRTLRTDRGFWLFWDGVLDADAYSVEIEYLPDIWVPIAPNVTALEYEFKMQTPGDTLSVRAVARNSYGQGATSEPLSVTILQNLALPSGAGGATPPLPQAGLQGVTYAVSHYDINGTNNGAHGDNNDSWYNNEFKAQDFWGYLWDTPLWFDEITYYTGGVFFDGGWFTDLTIEYTEDGTTWVDAPNVNFAPEYDFANGPGGRDNFSRYTITFGTVRGTGIRIFGTPGGMVTFTSIAELEVYGDKTRGDLVVQGLDLEVPERGTATLDGSHCMSLIGDITSYSWSQTSGPTVAIADSTAAVTTFTAPPVDEDTVLVFSLTAGDGTNEGTDADVRVTVKNVTTTAVAGVDQTVAEGTVVNLDGTGSQTATGALTYSWTQTAGPEVTLSDPAAATCSFTAPEIWPYVHRLTFELAVDDGEGGTGSDVANVNVTNSVFETKPLATYYFQDLLHLGNTPEERFLSPLDISLDTNDYLADWGGQANVNPVEGEAYDFTDTGISTSANPMVWTPVHRDNGWFMSDGRTGQALDYFGQIYHIYIFSPEPRQARFHFRHDDEVRIWSNGEVAVSREGWDGGGEQSQDFDLHEGVNSMTLRFEEGDGGNYIAARLTDRNDVPFADLSYALSVRTPIAAAYGLRALPVSYASPGTVNVQVSVRANPDNLPTTIAVREILPEGVTVADDGGGTPGAGTLTWTFDGVSSAVISYSLSVPAGSTAGLAFAGDVNGEDTLGDTEMYAVPSAPQYVSLDTMFGAQLSWSPPPEEGADAYRVYRSVDGGDWTEVAFTRQTSYSEGVAEGSTYSYKVMAVNKNGVEGPFCEATEPATVTVPIIREAENYNYGGGLYPGSENCPAANEAPDSDTVGTPADYDFYFNNTWPVGDPARAYRPEDDVFTELRVDTPNVGGMTVGDWLRYTFDVPAPGAGEPTDGWAMIGIKAASPSGGTAELYWDEGLLGTVSFNTGDWEAFVWAPLAEAFRTTPGEHTLRVKLVSGGLNIDTIGVGFNQKISRDAIFEDDFEGYTNLYDWNDLETVGNWDVTNGSGEPDVGWRLWNTAGDYLGDETEDRDPAIAGMTGNYVISDSDLVGTAALDEELVTPDIDCTDYIRLKLDFSKNFRVYPDDADHTQIAELDIREVGGGWVKLLSYNVNSIDPNLDPAVDSTPEKLDLSAYDGKTFQLRWRFYDASWDWWFAIDNVMVSGDPKPTEPPPKGVIKTVSIADGQLTLTWSEFGTTGDYYIERSIDLLTWEELNGPITDTSSSVTIVPPPGTEETAYYRVRSE